MKLLRYCFLITAFIATSAIANADYVPIGDPIEGNSWTQQFNESGVGNYDLMGVVMVSADDYFEGNTFSGYTVGGWAAHYKDHPTTPTVASAIGPKTDNMTFNITFSGSSSNPLDFYFYAFDGDVIIEIAKASWSGTGWSITDDTLVNTLNYQRGDFVIPVPGAALLGMIGLGFSRWVLRRAA